jgi:predicted kinase
MNTFAMLVGIVGSGKSTYAEKLKAEGRVVHSSDALREELFGDVNVQDRNDELFKELHRRIKEDLKNGKNVVFDACNISMKKRMAFLQEIKNLDVHKKCILFATPYEDCLANNLKRERKVPEEVIKKMYMNFNVPGHFEGWEDIDIVWNSGDRICDIPSKSSQLSEFDQKSRYHTLSLGEHCRKCRQNLKVKEILVWLAASLHDFGKEFTQTIDENGEAHYYNHEFVSAYDSLFYNKFHIKSIKDKDVVYIANLIQFHMRPFGFDSEKARQKFIDLVGQTMYNDIMILHEADKNAK